MVGAMAGAALLFGVGIMAPAISLLSAVEGVHHFPPGWQPDCCNASVGSLFKFSGETIEVIVTTADERFFL